MNLREKLARMMSGRYGVDALSKALLYSSVVILFLSIFIPSRGIFNFISLILLAVCYYRIFSKDFINRQKENVKYINLCKLVKFQLSKLKYYLKESRTHHIYHCPNCKQKIRIPRGKGKISIRCPKCHEEFIKRS